MEFDSESRLDGGVLERRFHLGDAPGILWTPGPGPRPVVLLGHPGGLDRLHGRLLPRALAAVADGFAAATVELPGSGGRPPVEGVEAARAELRRTLAAGEPVGAGLVDRLVLPLVERAVPEWRAVLAALPGDGPAAIAGGFVAVAVRLAVVEPRLAAAVLFAGSYLPRATFADARRVTVPTHVLLQWDDEGNDRQQALDLYDALGSTEKALSANLGGHTGVPPWAGAEAHRFLARHLG
jgi:hypothetical protein